LTFEKIDPIKKQTITDVKGRLRKFKENYIYKVRADL
jgi:hypothetical protein